MATVRVESFGELLRRYRRAFGLSQEQLAEQAGLSVRAISDLERGVKQRPHRETVQQLAQALRLDPRQSREFELAARSPVTASWPLAPTDAAAPLAPQQIPTGVAGKHNLPFQTSRFVGREHELEQIRGLFWKAGVRLVTLSGPGGSGKTRLALEVAATLIEDFAAGD